MRFRCHLGSVKLCLKAHQYSPRRTLSTSKPLYDGYYLLLPAVPPDTATTNPLLQTSGLPRFDQISEDQVLNALGKITIDYESAFYRLEEEIQKTKRQRTFKTVFDPLERLNHGLVHAFTSAKILSGVRKSQGLEEALLQSQQAVRRCLSLANTSQTLLRAIREMEKEESNLSEAQKGVIGKYKLESRLSGMNLNSKDLRVYQSVLFGLREKQEKFRFNLVTTARLFSTTIMDFNTLSEAPKEAIQVFAKAQGDMGKRLLTLRAPAYNTFMKYCSDRKSRWNVWQALVGRAGFRDPDTNNSLVIEDIRQMRVKEAKILGYDNYAALSMETKMAGSVTNIMSVVSEMTIPSKTKCQTQLVDLQKFAHDNGFPHELQLWDMAYWRRRQWDQLYRIKQDEIRPYFPLPVVLDGIFALCRDLFGITIKQSDGKAPIWHKDVQFFNIFDENGKEISGFYLDPYLRPEDKDGTPRCELGQNRSDAAGSTPLAALIFNFMPPSGKIPSLLTYDDLSVFAQKFGAALQHLLTTVPYGDVSGVNNIQWDALDIAGNVFRMLLRKPEVLESLSKNVNNGKPLPMHVIERLHKAENHLSSLDLLSEMYFGVLDLSLYSKSDFWQDIMKDVWRDFIPFNLEKIDAHPCGFAHIFIGDYAASYYSFLWSEMVAADVLEAFNDSSLPDKSRMNQIGRKFRDTFLSLGGSVSASDVFRQFRGRDPSPQCLLRLHEIV